MLLNVSNVLHFLIGAETSCKVDELDMVCSCVVVVVVVTHQSYQLAVCATWIAVVGIVLLHAAAGGFSAGGFSVGGFAASK
jgi:hypothetical protein